jgi:hypothetical protein
MAPGDSRASARCDLRFSPWFPEEARPSSGNSVRAYHEGRDRVRPLKLWDSLPSRRHWRWDGFLGVRENPRALTRRTSSNRGSSGLIVLRSNCWPITLILGVAWRLGDELAGLGSSCATRPAQAGVTLPGRAPVAQWMGQRCMKSLWLREPVFFEPRTTSRPTSAHAALGPVKRLLGDSCVLMDFPEHWPRRMGATWRERAT